VSDTDSRSEFTITIPRVDGGEDLPIEVRAIHDTLRPDDIWKEKDKVLEMEQESLKEWATMSEDDRETVLQIVGNALDRLIEIAPEWTPASLRIQPGEYIDINFRLLFSDVESELRNSQAVTQRRIKQAAVGTAEMVREFDEPESEPAAAS